jgi:phage/plasmid-associated DNA primase
MIQESDLKSIIECHGEPAYANARGRLTKLNDNFWAAYYARCREKIIFEPSEKEFYDYSSAEGIFLPKSVDVIRTELSALVFDAAKSWSGYFGINSFRNAENLNGSISLLRGQVEERDFFNNDELLVHLGNCTLRFAPDGGGISIEGFSPLHRSRNRSPINYDPKATCSEFKDKLLGHVSGDDKIILQKYGGQCLLGRNLMQRLLILDGIGGSSKSAFVLVLNGIVGQGNSYELRAQHLEDRFEIGRMIGHTLLIGPDVRGNFLSLPGSHRIKSLVGGDKLEAELKCSNEEFKIYGNFNLVITSNNRLYIRIDSDQKAWERRLLIARYETVYNGQRIFDVDRYLLRMEAPGILNWCIEGLQMLLADYKQSGDIILPESQQTRISNLLSESDSLRIFVENEITRDDGRLNNGESYSLTSQEIISQYTDDCVNDKHWAPMPVAVAEKRLPDLMLRYFGTPKSNDLTRNGKTQRGFRHVRWN